MKTYTLNVDDNTSFKEMGAFIHNNQIKEGDELVINMNLTYEFNFMMRQVFFFLVRECVSNNRQAEFKKRLPETTQKVTEFYEDELLAKALTEDTGVLVSVK